MGWEQYLKEGFEKLERFQGEIVEANYVQGQYGLQLACNMRVDAIEEPAGTDIPTSYTLWFSIGDTKGKEGWTLDNGSLWNAKDGAAIASSSNLGRLMQRCMELNAPVVNQNLPPTDKNAWLTLGTCIWVLENVERRNIEDSSITLPVACLEAGYQAPTQVAAPSANGNGHTPVGLPPMVDLPPSVSDMAISDLAAHWDDANRDRWVRWMMSLVIGKSRANAEQALKLDNNLKADSVVQDSLENGQFWPWVNVKGYAQEQNGVMVGDMTKVHA